ncbi:MAG: phage tail tube protein [Caulobacteraceae bacterium]
MTAVPNRVAGVAYLSVDGVSYALRGELTYTVSSSNRESVTGQDSVHGFSEKPMPGSIGGKFTDTGSVSVKSLADMTNVTVVADLANGKLIVGRNMWRVGEPPEVNTEDGSFSIKWESADVTEN